MAEMTQEMYGASGRVGNKTYYRSNGKTVARDQGSFIDLESEYYLNNAGEGGAQKTATTVTFSELDGAAGDTFTFYKASGQSWFVVTVSAPGGGGQSEDDEN